MEKGEKQQQEGTRVEEDPGPFWLLKDVQSTPARTPWLRHTAPSGTGCTPQSLLVNPHLLRGGVLG